MIDADVKPYLVRIKDWKIRNMVMLYLDARDKFKNYHKLLRVDKNLSFERMREICDVLFEVKEDHHLLYKRLLDPKKNKFEAERKFMPDEVELRFMNNVGLLFHKMLVARELKYLLEHYVEQNQTYTKNKESLHKQLGIINALFDDGIVILKDLISQNSANMLLLTLLLDDPEMTKRNFGKRAIPLIEQFGNGLADIYYTVGRYYLERGWRDQAKRMLKNAVRKDGKHRRARVLLRKISAAEKT